MLHIIKKAKQFSAEMFVGKCCWKIWQIFDFCWKSIKLETYHTHKPIPQQNYSCLCTTKKRENTMCVGRKKVTENNLTRDPGTPTEGRANNHKNGRERKGVHIVVYRRENVAIIRSAKSIP